MRAIEQIDIELSNGTEVNSAEILFQKSELNVLGNDLVHIREEFRSRAAKLRPVVNAKSLCAIPVQCRCGCRTTPGAYLQIVWIRINTYQVINERSVFLT